MAIADNAVGFLTSYELATTSWRRAALDIEDVPAGTAHEWPATTTVLGGLLAGFEDPVVVDQGTVFAEREHDGEMRSESVSTADWFEDVHTLPRAIDLGLVISTVETVVEVHNAYRRVSQDFEDWINHGGAGIDLLGESFPMSIPPNGGTGTEVRVEVTTAGDPIVDSYMEFVWGVGTNIVTIILTRAVPLATTGGLLIPEEEIVEYLEFRTDVIAKANRREQRIKLRKNPRQVFEHVYKIPEGVVRSELDLLLAALQHRLYSVGVWEHEVALTAAAAIGDTVLSVEPTDYSDFREGGTLAVFVEDGDYEFRSIAEITSTTITIANGLTFAFPVGARVVPMRSAFLDSELEGGRWPVNLTELAMRFEVADNDVDLADVSAFPAYRGKVLLEDYNFQRGKTPDGLVRSIVALDGEVGTRYRESDQDLSLRTRVKTFQTKTRADAWAVRRLLHALAGQLTSFYLPSFREDLEVSAPLSSGSNELYVFFAGYSTNAQGRQPFDELRIELVDGTTIDRGVVSSGVDPSGETETLVLDDVWPDDIQVEEVARISYIDKVRSVEDRIRIDHQKGGASMRVAIPVRAVLE